MATRGWAQRSAAGIVIVFTAATMLAGCLPAPTRDLAVYVDGGQTHVNAFAAWLGRTPTLVNSYLPDAGAGWDDPTPWLHAWQDAPWKMSFGVPMLAPGGTLADGAAGAFDAHYQTLAEKLVAEGLNDATLRLGYEFNGNWFRWRAAADPEAFVAFWKRIVVVMRSVAGANFKFDWNIIVGRFEIKAALVYPGDQFVDYIGVNVFDSWPAAYPIPEGATEQEAQARREVVWNDKLNGKDGLSYWAKFAANHKKYLSIPEWAVVEPLYFGGGDNAYFIERMHDWITHANVTYYAYFNGSGGLGDHRLTGATAFPAAAARYQQLFG